MSTYLTDEHEYQIQEHEMAPNGILQNGYYNVIANVARFIQMEKYQIDYNSTSKLGFEVNSLEYYTRYFKPIIGIKKIYVYSRLSLHPKRKTCFLLESAFVENKVNNMMIPFKEFEGLNCLIEGTAVCIRTLDRKPIRVPEETSEKLFS